MRLSRPKLAIHALNGPATCHRFLDVTDDPLDAVNGLQRVATAMRDPASCRGCR